MNNCEKIASKLRTLEALNYAFQEAFTGRSLNREEAELAEYALYHIFDFTKEIKKEAQQMADEEAQRRTA